MKKMMAILSAALLLAVLPSCGGTTLPAVTTAADLSTTESVSVLAPETDLPDSTWGMQFDAMEPYGETFATTLRSTTEAVASEAAQSQTSAVSKELTTAPSTTAPVSETEAAVTTAAAESTTARRTILERILANIDAEKGKIPLVPDKEFFNDAVFVGDSVTLGLKNYTTAQRNKGKECLGTAQFLCVGSMSYTNALSKVTSSSLHPTYKGQKMTVEEGLQKAGARKAFIMLGMNDFSAYSDKVWKQSVVTLISRIREKNPEIGIYIQSVTPILDGMEHGRFSNENILVFNSYLKSFCEENDCAYIDIGSEVMADETGHLKKAYCGDPSAMGIHMSSSGCSAWASYLMQTFCGVEEA